MVGRLRGPVIARVERPSDHEVIFHRLLEARPEQVWKLWSDPDHLRHWFGPAGFTLTTEAFAFVPGGEWRFVMHAPDGRNIPNRIVFRELIPPTRLVYDNRWDGPGPPLDFRVTIMIVADGAHTDFSIRLVFRDAASMRAAVEVYGVIQGGIDTLDRMAAYASQ